MVEATAERDGDEGLALPQPSVAEVDNCRFSSWYSSFRHHTIPSTIIPLDTDFAEFLNDGGGVYQASERAATYLDEESDYSDTEEWALRDEDEEGVHEPPSFPHLEEQINQEIRKYGSVFPKLNWSAPQDAVWMTSTGTLQCQHASDVILLLKSSDHIVYDLDNVYDDCVDAPPAGVPRTYELVLRKWMPLQPSMEFRCLVKDKRLIGVAQRHCTVYFPFLEEKKDYILQRVSDFFASQIQGKFPNSNFVFDVYVGDNGRVRLIDFNIATPTVLNGPFDWSVPSDNQPLFYCLTSDVGIQPSPLATGRLPQDIVDLTSGNDIDKFVDLFRQNKWDSDDHPLVDKPNKA